jgi:hypothetical protein
VIPRTEASFAVMHRAFHCNVINCGGPMKHASFSTSIDSSTSVISSKTPTRKNLFARLLEALHHSRRLQAQRVLGQYRHLIARYEPVAPTSSARGDEHVGH